jgi:uncharacterized protein
MKKHATHITSHKPAHSFPEFKDIEVEDRPIISGYGRDFGITSCEYSFANLYCWQPVHHRVWSLYRNRLLILDQTNDGLFLPAGEALDTADLVYLSGELQKRGMSGNVTQVSGDYVKAHPDLREHYSIERQRDFADYIYATQKLITLSGKKLHKKKNLISQFRRSWPEYTVAPIDADLKRACRKLAQTLLAQNAQISRTIREEQLALRRAFSHFDEAGLEGLALLVSGKLVAFSVFSRLNSDMFDIHFEKSDPAFKGAAQVINYETARHLAPRCRFVNREQDIGIEGLRQAKRSYDPERIASPYRLNFKAALS